MDRARTYSDSKDPACQYVDVVDKTHDYKKPNRPDKFQGSTDELDLAHIPDPILSRPTHCLEWL